MRVHVLLVVAMSAMLALGQEQDFSKVELKVTHVAGTVYMLEATGAGNIAASVGDDGIVIVDDQYAPLAEKIRAALKSVSDKPVRFVINTHWHGDHTGGNLPFSTTSTIIAQENVRRRLQTGGAAGNGASVHFDAPASPKEALPIVTFEHEVSVHLNGEDVRALHFPHGHTDGDSIIFFPKSGVVHMGDDFVTYGFPFIDIETGGSARGMIAAIENVLPRLPPDVKVIPGHGPVSNLDDVRRFVTMLKETNAAVEVALKQGKSLDQMKQAKVLDRWKKWSGDFISTDAFLETLYNDQTGHKGDFIKHN
jgi:cyclase